MTYILADYFIKPYLKKRHKFKKINKLLEHSTFTHLDKSIKWWAIVQGYVEFIFSMVRSNRTFLTLLEQKKYAEKIYDYIFRMIILPAGDEEAGFDFSNPLIEIRLDEAKVTEVNDVIDTALILANILKKYKALSNHLGEMTDSKDDYTKGKIVRRNHHWGRKLNMPIMRTNAYTFHNDEGLYRILLN